MLKGKERKGKRGGRRGKAQSLVLQRGQFVVRGGREQNGLGESIHRKADIHPTGIPFINLACFRTTQETISNEHDFLLPRIPSSSATTASSLLEPYLGPV